MYLPPSSHFMATGRIFNKVLPPSIPGFPEQGTRPVSELSTQRSDVFDPPKHKIKEASESSGF